MIDPRELDAALAMGALRVRPVWNVRPVKCAACGADCLRGQAQQIVLAGRWWRTVYLCAACTPQDGKA